MFAGPNGSGKSHLKDYITAFMAAQGYPEDVFFGHYINADELLKNLRSAPLYPFAKLSLDVPDPDVFKSFFLEHPLTIKKGLSSVFSPITVTNDSADFSLVPFFPDSKSDFKPDYVGNYLASVFADWLRHALLRARQSFSFETVMSGPDKVQLLADAQAQGYRIYLYFVTTKDPIINIGRVRFRVSQGGHDVKEEDIRTRYTRTMQHLREALKHSYRSYLFDNSNEQDDVATIAKPVYIAELLPSGEIEFETESIPEWFFEYVSELP